MTASWRRTCSEGNPPEQEVCVEAPLDRTTPEAFERFKEMVAAQDEIMECHMAAGGFDCLLKVRVKDMGRYRTLLGEPLPESAACSRRTAIA